MTIDLVAATKTLELQSLQLREMREAKAEMDKALNVQCEENTKLVALLTEAKSSATLREANLQQELKAVREESCLSFHKGSVDSFRARLQGLAVQTCDPNPTCVCVRFGLQTAGPSDSDAEIDVGYRQRSLHSSETPRNGWRS